MTTSNISDRRSNTASTDFAEARRTCRTPAEREQLAMAVRSGWTPSELREYARLYFFKNGKDYPTATSYRRAIADIPSSHAQTWLKSFRKGGSKPRPPRREGLLKRGRGLSQYRVDDDEYAWPGHTEEFRSMIEQQARDYFNIAPGQRVHVNAWEASKRAHDREQLALALASRRATEATTLCLAPRKKPPNSLRRKVVSSFDYNQGPLKPHFNHDFEGHTDAFREEVAVWARKDNGLRPNAYISPRRWKAACHKHYVLIEK